MLPKLEQLMSELSDKIEELACAHVKEQSFPVYRSKWYQIEQLKSCYCLGKDDIFPCPHCMDYKGVDVRLGHPALVAEYARHWRVLIHSHTVLTSGGSKDLNAKLHETAREDAAYHLYALLQDHITVTRSGSDEWLVQDKDGAREGRNAVLAMRGLPTAKDAPPTSISLRYNAPQWMLNSVSRPRMTPAVYEGYKLLLRNMLGVETSNLSQDGEALLVEGPLLDAIIQCPHTAGYVVHEQTLVVKIQYKDLVKAKNALDEKVERLQALFEQWSAQDEPVTDWLSAALETPPLGHSMCHELG